MIATKKLFLKGNLIKLGYLHSNGHGQSLKVTEVIQQAKEIEKQQISEAYEDGYSDSDNTFELNKEYYKEKY